MAFSNFGQFLQVVLSRTSTTIGPLCGHYVDEFIRVVKIPLFEYEILLIVILCIFISSNQLLPRTDSSQTPNLEK
jgi:hypothetical protein